MINYRCIKEDYTRIVLEFDPSYFNGFGILFALADWKKVNPCKKITYISFNNADASRFLREEYIKEEERSTPGSFCFKFENEYKVITCDNDLNRYQVRVYYTIIKEKVKKDMEIIVMPMSLDTRKLNDAIREFKKENDYDPIIQMNYETFLAIDPLDRNEKVINLGIDKSISCKQAYYKNIQVYFDNNLPNGAAEVR